MNRPPQPDRARCFPVSAARKSWIQGIEIYLRTANTASLQLLNKPPCPDRAKCFPVSAARKSWIQGEEIYLGSANSFAAALHLLNKPPSREPAEVFSGPEPAAVIQQIVVVSLSPRLFSHPSPSHLHTSPILAQSPSHRHLFYYRDRRRPVFTPCPFLRQSSSHCHLPNSCDSLLARPRRLHCPHWWHPTPPTRRF